jgi:hypothetical protein
VNRSIRTLASFVAVSATVIACITLGAPAAPKARWSDPATWNGHVPRAGANVTIPPGRAVLMDVSPPHLASLAVDGQLRFAERDLVLRAGGIAIRGALRVGSPDRPYAHHAEIVLNGSSDGRGALAFSSGGRLELHGTPRVSWTTLAATARPGDRSVLLANIVDWQRGDRLAIAPSGFDPRETEEVVVASARGTGVVLAAPLRFRHWGTFADGIDERAEVGLLSHGIVVRGESRAAARGIGGQVIVLRGGTLRASDVEFRELGQRGKRGRYPIHFHEAGDATGSFVAASSVDHSFNRCVAIHGTSGVVVRDDVASEVSSCSAVRRMPPGSVRFVFRNGVATPRASCSREIRRAAARRSASKRTWRATVATSCVSRDASRIGCGSACTDSTTAIVSKSVSLNSGIVCRRRV